MPGAWSRPITDEETERIAAEINRRGYGTLSNFVSEDELAPIRDIARANLRASGGEYALWKGAGAFTGTVLSELAHSAAFKNVCRRLFELGGGDVATETEFYQTFRCLQGGGGQARRHFYAFHYDGFILTTILPVAIPEHSPHGDLLIFPNTRRIRRRYLYSLVESNFVRLAPVQLILRMIARQRKLNIVAVRLKPGDLYFIWGYQSLHANEPCAQDALRATAIFQYGNPHDNSKLGMAIRTIMPRMGIRRLYWQNKNRRKDAYEILM